VAYKIVVRCKQCGERRLGDALGPACPNCGLMEVVSTIQMEVLGSVEKSETLPTENARTYPGQLMNLAADLIKEKRYPLAVIVVHMACEIAVERAIWEALDARGAQYTKEDRFLGYNLKQQKVRKLYKDATGDNVPSSVGTKTWKAFKTSSNLRNSIIHEGQTASEIDAAASYGAADALLRHLESRKTSSP
jgi:hypothetical protein